MGAGSHKHIIAFAWVRHSFRQKEMLCDYTTVYLVETSVGRVNCDLEPKAGPFVEQFLSFFRYKHLSPKVATGMRQQRKGIMTVATANLDLGGLKENVNGKKYTMSFRAGLNVFIPEIFFVT